MDWIKGKIEEVITKLWNIAKFCVPILAIWEFLSHFFKGAIEIAKVWLIGRIEFVKAIVEDQLSELGVSLEPPAELVAIVAKINVLVPLEEAWSYFLTFLAFASVVVGVKWTRNLTPGIK